MISLSLVISSRTGWRLSLAKRMSRLVRMPTSLPLPRSTTGKPGDLVLLHQAEGIGERLVGMDGQRIDHHAGFELLDPADLLGLLGDVEILVDDADPAGLGHGDGHMALRHRIHGRGEQRDAELDGRGQPGPGIGGVREDGGGGRLQQDIVEGKRLTDLHAKPPGGGSLPGNGAPSYTGRPRSQGRHVAFRPPPAQPCPAAGARKRKATT